MRAGAALLTLSVAAALALAVQSSCRSFVHCPCGKTGGNVTVCHREGRATENDCSKWAGCGKCQDGLDGCLECPHGFEGPFCEKASKHKAIHRQKRQYHTSMHHQHQYSNRISYQNGPRWSSVQQGVCHDMDAPKRGSIRCYSDNRERICTGTCLPGYTFENRGSESEIVLRCENGQWTPLNHFPTCKSGGHCDLEIHGAGTYNCTTGMTGTRCDVRCGNQYVVRHRCYPGQSWDPPLPYCVRPKVQPPEDYRPPCRCEHGGSCDNSGQCVCPAGTTGTFCEIIQRRTCNDPGFISHGYRKNMDGKESTTPRTFEEGESVVFGCRSRDYALKGSSILTCGEDGTWSEHLPECIKPAEVLCSDPGYVDYGDRLNPDGSPSIRDQQYRPGESVTYACRAGYVLQRQGVLTCLPSGTWSGGPPYCRRIRPNPPTTTPASQLVYCRDPGTDTNGVRNPPSPPSHRGFPQGSSLRYTCNENFDLNGETQIFCLTSGKWSSSVPTCVERQRMAEWAYCRNPGPIENGRVTYLPSISNRRTPQATPEDPEYPEGARLQYACNSGYTVLGSSVLTCEESGEWSSRPPTCTRVRGVYCLNPGSIENGRVTYLPDISDRSAAQPTADDPEYPEGARLQYTCNDEYTLLGSRILTCEKSGEWSSERPLCTPDWAYCPNPGPIENGRVTYLPNISNRRSPQGAPEDPEYPEGARLQYACNSGYTVLGSSVLTCEESGEWSSRPPTCNRAHTDTYCENPGRISNGKIVIYPVSTSRTRPSPVTLEDPEYPQGTRLQYRCNSGFTLNGRSSTTCEVSGLWSADPPICRRGNPSNNADTRYCKNPGPVANGRVTHNPPPNARRRPQGSGDEEYQEGSRLQYSCDNGYTLQGTRTLTCRSSGAWSDTPPKCIAATVPGGEDLYCDNPGTISNGRIRYQPPTGPASRVDVEDMREFPQDSRLEYSCDDGYTLEGRFSLVCEPNGMWSSSPPRCTAGCGKSFVQAKRKIIHGTKTLAGEWPWVVAIAVREGNALVVKCGAALLDSRTILTAAHCLTIANSFTLYFGKFHLEKNDSAVKVARSQRIIIHPDYSSETMDSDIGLVKFAPRVRFDERVQPICLPSPETTAKNLMTGKKGFVTGWGLTNFSVPSEQLLLAELPVLTNDACMDSYRRQNLQFDMTSNMFCAGFEDGRQSVCRGDSGSPLVFYDKNTATHTLEGLVSFGVVGQCGTPGRYSVFTKVFRFVPWILRNT